MKKECEEIVRYSIYGYYKLAEKKVSQRGSISYYSDGKIIGNVRHRNDDANILFGIRVPKSNDIGLIKVLKFEYDVTQVLWRLQRENKKGVYTGSWMLDPGISIPDNFFKALNENSSSYNSLAKIPAKEVEKFFNQSMLEKISSRGRSNNFKIRLEFVTD